MSEPRGSRIVRTVLLLSAGLMACSGGDVDPAGPDDVGPILTISGFLRTLDGTSPGDVTVVATTGTRADTAVAEGDGTFALRVPAHATDSTVVDVRPAGAWRRSWKILAPPRADVTLRVLLVPTVWRIERGIFAGDSVPLSLQTAFAPENTDGHFMAVTGGDEDDQGIALSPVAAAWPEDRHPLPVWIDREGEFLPGEPVRPPTPEDSASIWAAFDTLESRLGRDLFRPAVQADLPADSGQVFGPSGLEHRLFSIEVQLVPQLGARGYGRAVRTCGAPAGLPDDACGRFGPGVIVAGRLTLRAEVATDPHLWAFLVTHEMTHVLGFGHACFSPSTMTPCSGPFRRGRLPAGWTGG